jgi:ankyrin repeat protein
VIPGATGQSSPRTKSAATKEIDMPKRSKDDPDTSNAPAKLPDGVRLIPATSDHVWAATDVASIDSGRARLRDGLGRSLLHVAAASGDGAAVRALLQVGADANARDLLGETPLIQAARRGHLDVARLLIDAGTDLNARHLEGWTALAAAVIRGHEEVVELLLGHEQDVNAAIGGIGQGMDAVRMAVQIGHAGILRRLLAAGACLDHRGFDGRTPLELAQHLGREDCVKMLEAAQG